MEAFWDRNATVAGGFLDIQIIHLQLWNSEFINYFVLVSSKITWRAGSFIIFSAWGEGESNFIPHANGKNVMLPISFYKCSVY